MGAFLGYYDVSFLIIPLFFVVGGPAAYMVLFYRQTSAAGQERIRLRSEHLNARARKRALNDPRRGFEVDQSVPQPNAVERGSSDSSPSSPEASANPGEDEPRTGGPT